jgi:hypothetical protein
MVLTIHPIQHQGLRNSRTIIALCVFMAGYRVSFTTMLFTGKGKGKYKSKFVRVPQKHMGESKHTSNHS